MLLYIWIDLNGNLAWCNFSFFHDVVITLGIFSIFIFGDKFSIVAAVLTIVGYSMNDTVVIFDRVSENFNKIF